MRGYPGMHTMRSTAHHRQQVAVAILGHRIWLGDIHAYALECVSAGNRTSRPARALLPAAPRPLTAQHTLQRLHMAATSRFMPGQK